MQKTIFRKNALRLLPFLFILYIFNFLDRVNFGYAALEMNQSLSITPQMFGLLSGIFFAGYLILEIPSNIILHKVGARKWMARIVVSWGIVSVFCGFADSANHLLILRFLLGIAEAGFFPGIILYLTFWFRREEMATIISLFMAAIAVSNIIGAPISTAIMQNIKFFHMEGWRWLFILEGLPSIILGVITFFYLPDRPEQASWLTNEEKKTLVESIRAEKPVLENSEGHNFRIILTSSIFLRFALIYFTFAVGLYSITFWLPQIIKKLSHTQGYMATGWIAMGVYILSGIGMIVFGYIADRTNKRKCLAIASFLLAGLFLFLSTIFFGDTGDLILIALAMVFVLSIVGPLWGYMTTFVKERQAAIGIAFVNSVGNIGGFAGPLMIGFLMNSFSSSIEISWIFVSIILVIGGIVLGTIHSGRSPNAS